MRRRGETRGGSQRNIHRELHQPCILSLSSSTNIFAANARTAPAQVDTAQTWTTPEDSGKRVKTLLDRTSYEGLTNALVLEAHTTFAGALDVSTGDCAARGLAGACLCAASLADRLTHALALGAAPGDMSYRRSVPSHTQHHICVSTRHLCHAPPPLIPATPMGYRARSRCERRPEDAG